MPSFRYVTPVLKGRWWTSRDQALAEALGAGQAYVSANEVRLFAFTQVEEREGTAPVCVPAEPDLSEQPEAG